MDEPKTRTLTITCPTKGCDDSQLVTVPIGRPLSELGEQTCAKGHRFAFLPTGQAAAIEEKEG